MIGQTFGNYRVTELIGEGGMGVVYLAEHPAIGRRAAVKILRPGLTDNVEITKRFFNEARAANAIRHPGIVEVFDCGTLPTGASYIVMELLEGENLAVRLRRIGKLPIEEARRIAVQTASALAAAHAAGIVHRDLKPDNLFLIPDERDPSAELIKVLDFGIAKLGQAGSNTSSVRTRTGSVMGTPAYMSPEQCRGTREIDHRTDIYALGVILYEMVCGRPPFVSEGFGEMVHLHISAAPPPPRTINPAIPEFIERLILCCLAKEPGERLQTMSDVHAALTGRPTLPPPVSAPARTPAPAAARANPTTFTQAAQARELGTDLVVRGRRGRAPALVNGANCGRCVELTYTNGGTTTSVTVTVVGGCDAATCPNQNFASFAVSTTAFQVLTQNVQSQLPMPGTTLKYSFVPCPLSPNQPAILGNVKAVNGTAGGILFVQQRYGISAVSMTDLTTNVTTALARGNDNYWTTASGVLVSSGSNGVMSFRLTDVNNAMITIPQYPLLNTAMFSSTNQQFPLCPSP